MFNLFPKGNYHQMVAENDIMDKLEQLRITKEEVRI
ncbi:hypothetical protein Megpolyxen_00936 [Candidatus Megaera polyxenophila]|nr:hypothetical protein Megpolyxen_00936 [Candidatus Megaera polyxenophila]